MFTQPVDAAIDCDFYTGLVPPVQCGDLGKTQSGGEPQAQKFLLFFFQFSGKLLVKCRRSSFASTTAERFVLRYVVIIQLHRLAKAVEVD